MPGTGGDAPVQRHGKLENDVGAFRALPDQKIGHQIAAEVLQLAVAVLQATEAEVGGVQAVVGNDQVQSEAPGLDNPVPDARREHGFRAGGRLAVMVAGLKRDHERAGRRINASGGGVRQTFDLGVALAAGVVPAARHDFAVAHEHRAYRRIGRGGPAAPFGQRDRLAHEGFKGMAHARPPASGHAEGAGRRGRSSSVTPASWSIWCASSSG